MAVSEASRVISVGGSALKSLRSFVSRGAVVTTPITMICGAIADLASTIAKFSLYLFVLSLLIALLSGSLWFLRYRRQYLAAVTDGAMQPHEIKELSERNVWSVLFAFSIIASIVMGGFVISAKMTGDPKKGVLANVVPGMDKLQASLFRIEGKLDAVKEDTAATRAATETIHNDTTALREDTSHIAASVDEIAKRFDSLASTGGLIPGAKTPEEHYHNARIQELNGNFTAARKEYGDYLAANLDVLDPWQSYAAMLKAQEGRADATQTLRYFGDKLTPRTVSYETTLALLEEPAQRLAKLQALAEAHPEYGPLPYLLSQEFSDARKGEQTLADKRAEKESLEKFRDANAQGRFLKFFLDKKEAQKWIEESDARWAKLADQSSLANPVTVSAMQSNSGWSITFGLADYKVKELFYQLDDKGDFISTGHLPNINPQTGLPMVNTHVPLLNLPLGEHTLKVKYTDKNDQVNGPYTLTFSTAGQQMAQGKMMLNAASGAWLSFRDYDGKVLLYFTTLMSYRPVITEVRYSLNSEAIDKIWKFKATETMYEVGDDIYTAVPADTQFANVQVTFKDGTKSAVQKYVRTK